jgi:uncharacterized membrane protein
MKFADVALAALAGLFSFCMLVFLALQPFRSALEDDTFTWILIFGGGPVIVSILLVIVFLAWLGGYVTYRLLRNDDTES